MPASRQTATFLIQRFKEVGLRPDTRKGQNFLIDLNLLRVLVDAAELGPHDVALEIGTGLGSLTGLLAEQAGAVVTVEIDAHLQQLASEEILGFSNVTMLCLDALRNKNNLDSRVLAAVQEKMSQIPDSCFKLVSNLPYNIATPVISNLLSSEISPVSMIVTIQKELADRITAKPSTKDYSALSIWVQSQCDTEILRVLPPEAFWPRPKVHSAILKIVLNPAKRSRMADAPFFHSFVRSMFFHRRKFLRSVLLSALKGKMGKPEVDALIHDAELDPQWRSEQLDVETMIRLCDLVRARLPAEPSDGPPLSSFRSSEELN